MTEHLRILVLTKRQYTNKDLIDDRFGRLWEIPLELARKGHWVTGLCLSYRVRKEGWMSDGPVRWKSINAGLTKVSGLARFIAQAERLSKEADVIWACSDSFYGIIGLFIARKQRIPLVFDLYDNFESFLFAKLPLLKQLYRYAVRKSDSLTCISHPLARLVSSYGRNGEVIVLENAVRDDLFRPMDKAAARRDFKLPQNSRIIGTAGALTKNRGISILFEAFEILKAKYPDIHMALAGHRDVGIPCGERIHDLGVLPLDRVAKFLNALDVGIICNDCNSFGEYCFPQKAREMMACNIPIVAAKIGSMEGLFEKHPWWLYTPNDPIHLARVIENRLNSRLTNYGPLPSWSDMADVLEGIFFNLGKGCGPRRWI
jgi:teichuronic acid biosynthesis glycosyltransferase TuaC